MTACTMNGCKAEGVYRVGLTYICQAHYQNLVNGSLTKEKPVHTPSDFQKRHPARRVAEVVADYYQISIDCLYSSTQTSECVSARYVVFTICREDLKMSYPQIGKIFNKDHTTVMNGCKVIAEKPNWWEKVLADVRARIVPVDHLVMTEEKTRCEHCGQFIAAEKRIRGATVFVLEGLIETLKSGGK